MNLQDPVSTIMSTHLITVQPDDKMQKVKDIMEDNDIHHVLVCKSNKLVGMISQTDLSHFLKGVSYDSYQDIMNSVRLKNYNAEEVMTEYLECISADDTIQKALEIFGKNKFHAIPIVKDNDEIEGIVTTFDIVNMLLETIPQS